MRLLFCTFIITILASCTKEVQIDIPNQSNQFVINGFIENNQPVKILLQRTLPYFDPVNLNITNLSELASSSFGESLINDATITLTNSKGETEELSLVPVNNLFGLNINTTDTWFYNYVGEMVGEEGMSYRIDVSKDDTILSAKATIPKLAPMDTLRFLYRPDDNNYCFLKGHWTDPDTIGNCERAFSKTNSSKWGEDLFFMSMLEQNGNYNDEYLESEEIVSFSFPMYKGRGFWQEWGQQQDEDDEVDGSTGATTGFWNIGDEVIVKWSAVDRSSWDFWASLEFNNPAGPFSTPSQAQGNVSGGLGVFGGMSSEYISLIADPELGVQHINYNIE